jgi:hypothetical protein
LASPDRVAGVAPFCGAPSPGADVIAPGRARGLARGLEFRGQDRLVDDGEVADAEGGALGRDNWCQRRP